MENIQLINDDYQGHVEKLRHACRGIIMRNGMVLLGYEAKNNKYIIPGGGLEPGETLERCCAREILEETGIVCRVGQNYLTIEELFDVWRHINHYFVCEVVEETGILHLTEGEAKAACASRWIPMEEALTIFGAYEQYRGNNSADFGLYRREYTALKRFDERSEL